MKMFCEMEVVKASAFVVPRTLIAGDTIRATAYWSNPDGSVDTLAEMEYMHREEPVTYFGCCLYKGKTAFSSRPQYGMMLLDEPTFEAVMKGART